jgi:hypothetical protein
MLDICTMWPLPWSRMMGNAACVIQTAPNRLVSN